jgi:phosphate-selective porin OprO/OprP
MGVFEIAALLALVSCGPPGRVVECAPPARPALTILADPQPPSTAKGPTQDAETPKPDGWHFRLLPGPSLRFRESVRLDFHARVQIDGVDSALPEDDRDPTDLDVGRRRIGVEGELGRIVQFEIEAELGSDETWRDVFVNYRQFTAVRVQAGKFKLPFSLDMNTGSTNLDFTHRSRAATQLAPGRDIGVVIHGRPFSPRLRYEVGVFEHDGRNARTNNIERVFGGTTVAGRITVVPFAGSKSELADLRVGVAATGSTLPEGFPALRGRTALDARFFRADVLVNGRRQRTGLELRWRPGPFSIQSEYIRVEDDRRGESVEDTDLSPLVASGWYLSGTWAITGERKAGGIDNPKRPLLPKAGIGAVELAARIEALSFRSGAGDQPPSTSPRADVIVGNTLHGVTLGVNWYLNRWIKVQVNFIRERVDDPEQIPFTENVFWSQAVRLQLAF